MRSSRRHRRRTVLYTGGKCASAPQSKGFYLGIFKPRRTHPLAFFLRVYISACVNVCVSMEESSLSFLICDAVGITALEREGASSSIELERARCFSESYTSDNIVWKRGSSLRVWERRAL